MSLLSLDVCVLSGYIATISDNQLTGSTAAHSDYSYRNSSLHRTGAWASGSRNVGQFIQADLGTVRRMEGIATQGQSNSDQWVTSYKFAYSADELTYSYTCILNLLLTQ